MYEFHENLVTDSHTSLNYLNEFLPILLTDLCKSWYRSTRTVIEQL